ncbi:MAG: DUF2196 domain-containing protein, partial [Hyphomicrobiaceae bacterium]|nr:DUF2196 domain-containing protein [Hyphomicrobiaceae bacterium]
SETHPHGIKVRLEDGSVGRVKEIGAGVPGAGDSGFVDLDTIPIPATESGQHEFKEFYQYNAKMDDLPGSMDARSRQKAMDGMARDARMWLYKAVASFGNSDGGFLYIGVRNDGTVAGLDKDMEFGGFGNYKDEMANHIHDTLVSSLGNKVFATSRVKMAFREMDGKTICIMQVLKAGRPLYIEIDGRKEFFMRPASAPRAERLDAEEQVRYIKGRFPDL